MNAPPAPPAPPAKTLTATQIGALIRAHRYSYANEVELHAGLEIVLAGAGLALQREVYLGPRDRPDILVDLDAGRRLGIEVKIAGSAGDVRRQLTRYSTSDQVDELMLVTTLARHLPGLPGALNGKPLHVVLLRGGL